MTVTFSARRSDQPLQIGSRHGYRIDGDQASINAEISVPPYHPGGAWALELWASERPYQGGELAGVLVSELQFELPTPLAPHTHRIEVNVPARLPQQGRAYFMLLALVEHGGERRVRDVASYPSLESFPAPQLEGDVGYEIRGHEVLLQAAVVSNPRAPGNLSGTLALELWGWPLDVPEARELGQGVCLGAAQLQPVAGGESLSALVCRGAFSEPRPGNYQLSLLLREWTHAAGYLTRDRRDFAQSYYVAAPAAVALEAEVPEVVALEVAVSEAAAPEVSLEVVALDAEVSEAAGSEAAVSGVVTLEADALEALLLEAEEPAVALNSEPPTKAPESASWEEVLPEAASWDAVLDAVAEPAVVAEAVAEPVIAEEAVAEPAVVAEAVAEPVVVAEAVVEPAVVAEAVAEPVIAEEAAAPTAELPVTVQAALPAPEAPPASVTRVSRSVSINAGSVEELARVKGLNTKVAKEIIKRRPYASVEELVEVRGIGRKMLDKIRSLITL